MKIKEIELNTASRQTNISKRQENTCQMKTLNVKTQASQKKSSGESSPTSSTSKTRSECKQIRTVSLQAAEVKREPPKTQERKEIPQAKRAAPTVQKKAAAKTTGENRRMEQAAQNKAHLGKKTAQAVNKPQQPKKKPVASSGGIPEPNKGRPKPVPEKASPKGKSRKPEKKEKVAKPKKKRKPKYYSELTPVGSTQDYLNVIDDIRGGMIVTNNHRYIYIMEIFPSKFNEKPLSAKKRVLDNFKRFPKAMPTNGHFYCTTEVTNIRTIIENIKTACPASRGKQLVQMRNAYIESIQQMAVSDTVMYRYFYSWEYEGAGGSSKKDIENIYRKMMLTKNTLKSILFGCDNMVAEPENENLYTLDILYRFFNKRSYREETIVDRIMRINADFEKCGKKPTVRDYIAPRSFVVNYDMEYLMMDGMFYTYLVLKRNAYPFRMNPDWITNLMCTRQIDAHFFHHKLPYESTKKRLSKKHFWGKTYAKDIRSEDRKENAFANLMNIKGILDKMKTGDDAIEGCTMLVIYRENPKDLIDVRDQLLELLKSAGDSGMPTESCYGDTEEYFNFSLPLVQLNCTIFNRNKTLMTSSAFKTVYCMTQYNCYDETDKSVVYGREENGTLVAINKFNKNQHINPHMVLIGTSGSGKTTAEMALGRRDIIMGVKAYYILPFKAFEHRDNLLAMNGTVIDFGPDTKNNYNIMALYPELTKSGNYSDKEKKNDQEKSILSRKITMLCTWFRILACSDKSNKYVLTTLDMNRISAILYKLYADFGITKDNESIWEDATHTRLKIMPILGYWYTRLREDERVSLFADLLVPFVSGIFKSYNRQSNLDLSNDLIVCDVDIDDIGEDLHPAVMYLAFICMSDLIRSTPDIKQSLYLDEVWRLMISEQIGKLVEEQVRVLRGYGGAVTCGSQDIAEFVGNKHGQAVIANSSIKIIMKLEPNEFEMVAQHIHLDESDRQYILGAKGGDMLIISNGSRTRCHLDIPLRELIDYITDEAEKQKLIDKWKAAEQAKKHLQQKK